MVAPQQPPTANHVPVLLEETLKHLVQSESGIYVDGTFGRGGHARALLARLGPDARVYAFDRDPEAVAVAQALAGEDSRLHVVHARFAELDEELLRCGVRDVAGVLLDVGVSSPQLDDAARGFSFRLRGPLDMRMDPGVGESAADWLNGVDERDLADVIRRYGEERFARRVAKAIVRARPLTTTHELADVVASAVPHAPRDKHPATRTFQAVRIHINRELEELQAGMEAAFAMLAPGGRLAVISFHSLEDRTVKRHFRSLCSPPALPRRLPVRDAAIQPQARSIAGPVRAGSAEVRRNPRARSATLRVVERVQPRG
jgi:16S rRNA (cytosine1402-N4)-methyltransferase